MRTDWYTTVKWVNGEGIKEIVAASSQSAAKRMARKLAMDRRPYNGSPVEVTASDPDSAGDDEMTGTTLYHIEEVGQPKCSLQISGPEEVVREVARLLIRCRIDQIN